MYVICENLNLFSRYGVPKFFTSHLLVTFNLKPVNFKT